MENLGNGFELRYTGGAEANSASQKLPANAIDIGRLSSESDVAEAMQQADALIFPSRSEGFGLVAAEAMACGLPVIATRGSSLPEVVEDGVSGILCNKDNVANFSDAARKLAANPELYKYMAKAARMRAINLFSSQGMVDAYVKIYTRYL
jgi:glycosyltransferase involved in cell wall biosynthesis